MAPQDPGVHYDLPEPEYKSNTPGFEFYQEVGAPDDSQLEGVAGGAGELSNGCHSFHDPYHCDGQLFRTYARAMPLEQIAHLHKDMKQILWQLDVVLGYQFQPEILLDLFKNGTHLDSIVFLLKETRKFVWDFLNREADNPAQVHVRFINMQQKSDRSAAAVVAVPRVNYASRMATFYLYPYSRGARPSLENFFDLRLDPVDARRMGAIVLNAPHILAHECFHAVSSFCSPQFFGKARTDPYIGRILGRYLTVTDVTISAAAVPSNSRDQRIVRKSLSRQDDNATPYGWENCLALASLRRGATAAMINADSYAVFVQLTTFEYLEHLLSPAKDWELRLADNERTSLLADALDELWKKKPIDESRFMSIIDAGDPALSDFTNWVYERKRFFVLGLMKRRPSLIFPDRVSRFDASPVWCRE